MAATYFRSGRGRSLNAEAAEAIGIVPASKAAKALGCKAGALLAARAGDCPDEFRDLTGSEWHHVGAYAAEVPFFDVAELLALYEELPAFAEWMRAWRPAKLVQLDKYDCNWLVPIGAEVLADVKYIEWSGPRSRPRAEKCELRGVRVKVVSAQFIEIAGVGRKKLGATGLEVSRR